MRSDDGADRTESRGRLVVFVATMTGTAEMIAEEIVGLYGSDWEMSLQLLEKADLETLKGTSTALIVSSTYGEGDVPEPAIPFLNRLREARPHLSHLTYGVIALGDSGPYQDTFAAGGRHWDRALSACGARRSGEILLIDASNSTDPVALALSWASEWLNALPSQNCAQAHEVQR